MPSNDGEGAKDSRHYGGFDPQGLTDVPQPANTDLEHVVMTELLSREGTELGLQSAPP